ncbi:MAG TPA: response regulator, partial [Candidatus Angelobacter sp.]|nr:response regulator [Candidatus Angelobacter sp.]
GAKRILSGIVTDALALAKKEPPAKPPFTVLLQQPETPFKTWLESKLNEKHDVRIILFKRASELLALMNQQPFDVAVVCGIEWDTLTHLEYKYRTPEAFKVLAGLNARYGKPIITMKGLATQELVERLEGENELDFWYGRFSTREFWDTLESCLPIRRDSAHDAANAAPQPPRARPPRIVVNDDEEMQREIIRILVKTSYKDATVLLFDDAEEALKELKREPPDLFTTDVQHAKIDGFQMLGQLAKMEPKCPAFVISGAVSSEKVLRYTDPKLDVTFFSKPFKIPEFRRELEKYFGPTELPDRPVPKHEA